MNISNRRSPLAIVLVAALLAVAGCGGPSTGELVASAKSLPREAGPQGRDHPAAQCAPEGTEQRRDPIPARPRVPRERRPGRRRGRAAQGARTQVSGRCGVAADRAVADRARRASEARDRVRQPRDQRPEGARRHPDHGCDRRAGAGRHQARRRHCSSRRSRRTRPSRARTSCGRSSHCAAATWLRRSRRSTSRSRFAPNDPEAGVMKAELMAAQRKSDDAIRLLEQTAAANPNALQVRFSLVTLLVSERAGRQGRSARSKR